MIDFRALTFAGEEVAEAVSALAAALDMGAHASAPSPRGLAGDDEAAQRHNAALIAQTAEALGLDALPVALAYGTLAASLSTLAPAIVRIDLGDGAADRFRYLLLVGTDRRCARVLTGAREELSIGLEALTAELARAVVAQPAHVVDAWLEQARVAGRRRDRARHRLLSLLLAERAIDHVWLLRRDPGDHFAHALRAHGWFRDAATFFAAAGLEVVLGATAFSLLGAEVLHGGVAPGWLIAWILLIAAAVPLHGLRVWAGGRMSVGLASALKQRLLTGALRLEPDTIRAEGTGGLLAMVSESEAVERAGLEGAVAALVGVLQLAAACVLLYLGAGGALHVALLLAACGLFVRLTLRTRRSLGRATGQRFELGKLFVEQVQGHRTRLVQGRAEHLHEREDELLERYAGAARALDHHGARLSVLPARGFLAVGLVGLLPALLGAPAPERIGLSLLGIVLAQQAFAALGAGLAALVTADVAWHAVRSLFTAAGALPPRARTPYAPPAASTGERDAPAPTVLELRSVSFRHGQTGRYALSDCDLTLRSGERVLLEGPSGSGKSTLASVMLGVYPPAAGLVLLDGLDRATLGAAGFRRRVTSAPQFHENHLLSAPLSFNLLMGRGWPPREEDLAEASETCRALGLSSLLARMPSGIHQIVGESGWQLSHGERSRVFLARALLQHAAVVVLDESFGALDPDTMEVCMRTVRARAKTLVVIAHP